MFGRRHPGLFAALALVCCAVSGLAGQHRTTSRAADGPAGSGATRRQQYAKPATAASEPRRIGLNLTLEASGPNFPVLGGGSSGRLTKWIGLSGSNSFIGDSSIFEDKTGNVGIGTDAPGSKLTVAGMIQVTLGGLKFPDGSVQTTAGASPGQVVRSLNGLFGDVALVPGSNITLTPSGGSVSISAPNVLTGIAHDATLAGNGTAASALGVALPLVLNAAVPGGTSAPAVVKITNTANGGVAMTAIGGDSADAGAGPGLFGIGGGGSGEAGFGGPGVFALGGVGRGHNVIAGDGLFAVAGSGVDGGFNSLAGEFRGDLNVSGNLSADGTKRFRIDHPLDPENKFLYHAAIESSEVLNIYSGNVITDEAGSAVVALPDWFEAVNRDFRYQLTVVGVFAQAIVASEIRDHRFQIKTSIPGVKVSWQVTGVRSDPAMSEHPFTAEEYKPGFERGYYVTPGAYNQPEERGLDWARHPQLMERLKQSRLEAARTKSDH